MGGDRNIEHEERQARELAALAALTVLDEVAQEDWPVPDHIEEFRVHYTRRRQSYADVEAANKQCTKEIAIKFMNDTMNKDHLTVLMG